MSCFALWSPPPRASAPLPRAARARRPAVLRVAAAVGAVDGSAGTVTEAAVRAIQAFAAAAKGANGGGNGVHGAAEVSLAEQPDSSDGHRDALPKSDAARAPPAPPAGESGGSRLGVTVVTGCDSRLRKRFLEKVLRGMSHAADQESAADRQAQQPPQPPPKVLVVTLASTSPALADEALDLDQAPSQDHHGRGPAADGWLLCSSPEEAAKVVETMASSRAYEYVLVESPTSRQTKHLADRIRDYATSVRIDTLVSVLDGASYLRELYREKDAHPDLSSADSDSDRDTNAKPASTNASNPGLQDQPASRDPQQGDSEKALELVSLIETANVVAVLNDAAPDSDKGTSSLLVQAVSTLNTHAKFILFSSDEQLDKNLALSGRVVNTGLYDPELTGQAATWRQVLKAARDEKPGKALPKALKDVAFLYRATRPFHPTRLYEHIKAVATFKGVIRSTGKFWLATRMRSPLEWEQAGDAATVRRGDPFFASLPETDWKDYAGDDLKGWDERFGDRATEIVFVGDGIDQAKIEDLLNSCLLQDEEMVFDRAWASFEDPFEAWVPAEDDEDDEDDVENAPDRTSTESQDAVEVFDDTAISDDLRERLSALDVLEQETAGSFRQVDKGKLADEADQELQEDEIMISSWDKAIADGILQKIPLNGMPVTIITGFLGSGKTTLLNYILTREHGLRIMVLVNEFGEIDIDNQVVVKGDWQTDGEVELANGCICCTVNESFITAMEQCITKFEDGTIDYVIVETTGVADPMMLVQSLTVPALEDSIKIDGIATMVDTENFTPTQMESEAALNQILMADTILLSKCDLVTEEQVSKTVNYVKELRPGARIIKSRRGAVPLHLLLDVGMRLASSPQQEELSNAQTNTADHDDHKHHNHGHDHDEHKHNHDHHDHHDHSHEHPNHLEVDGFVSSSFKTLEPLDAELFLSRFLQRLPQGVFRAKGLIQFEGYSLRYIFQLAGRRYQFEEDEWPPGETPSSQIVVIGRDLDKDELQALLSECIAE